MLGVLEQCTGCKLLQPGAALLCWEPGGPSLLLGLPGCRGVLDRDCERGRAGGSSPMSACGRGTQEQGRGWEPYSTSLWGLKGGGL